MFRLEIKTGGSTFRDTLTGDECSLSEAQEIVRILGEVKKQLESDMTEGSVKDYNGSTVGSWKRQRRRNGGINDEKNNQSLYV